jgi:hypothetical protein
LFFVCFFASGIKRKEAGITYIGAGQLEPRNKHFLIIIKLKNNEFWSWPRNEYFLKIIIKKNEF